MESRLLAVAAVAILVVTAGCAGTASPPLQGTDGSGDAPGRTVQVSGSGQVEAEPDQAVVRVAVVVTAADAATVRDRLAADAGAVREALADRGLADDAVRTAYYRVDADREQHREPQDGGESGYRGTHAFEVTVDDVERAGEVLDAAVDAGATRVDGVQFRLSEQRRDDLFDAALRDAVADARSQAETLAAETGLTLGDARSVTTGSVRYSPVRVETATAGDAGGTVVDGGPVTVTAQVSVTYDASA